MQLPTPACAGPSSPQGLERVLESGIDECIWITFQKLPQHVKLILFVVAAYNRGCLRDARNGRVHLLEERKDNEVGSFAMEDSAAEVDAICMMVRESSHWVLRVLDEPAQESPGGDSGSWSPLWAT
ncbi:unnamed protein product [Prorocentrum cordatum]|uniref:TerD domain-containing protein n=1 Tax=Prorocentrum cordatum TaxID=2364126 RepID=A0ABN9VT11_9DINO|nr:unnamed protein product [Polarella glacialis]